MTALSLYMNTVNSGLACPVTRNGAIFELPLVSCDHELLLSRHSYCKCG